jgi:hypothetical protein
MFRRKPQPRPPTPPATIDHAPQLSAAQRQTIDWTAPDERPARREPTRMIVPAASDIMPAPTVNLANPNVGIDANITPFATVEARTIGSHHDRARAWTRYSLPLCGALGVVTTVAAVKLYAVPLLSWSALLTFWGTFVIAYVVLLLRYWKHTPEGIALTNTNELWGHLRREQKHRHSIEREMYDDQRARNRQRIGGGK